MESGNSGKNASIGILCLRNTFKLKNVSEKRKRYRSGNTNGTVLQRALQCIRPSLSRVNCVRFCSARFTHKTMADTEGPAEPELLTLNSHVKPHRNRNIVSEFLQNRNIHNTYRIGTQKTIVILLNREGPADYRPSKKECGGGGVERVVPSVMSCNCRVSKTIVAWPQTFWVATDFFHSPLQLSLSADRARCECTFRPPVFHILFNMFVPFLLH